MVKVTWTKQNTRGLDSAVAEAKARVQHEISKRQEDIKALRAETLKLIQRMEEEEDTDDLLPEINALAKMVKRHNEAIRGLEEGSLQVEVEVERERCSVGLVVEAAENVVWRERRWVANREEARHLYFAGGFQEGVGYVASVYCWKEGEEEGKGWEAVSRLGQARAYHAMAVLGDQVYVLGGWV